MTTAKNENSPFPVLSNSSTDYNENIEFHVELTDDVKIEDDKVVIQAKYSLNSDGLNQLIREKKAACGIKVLSKATIYSRVYNFTPNQPLRIEIPKEMVAKKLELLGYIATIPKLDHPYKDNELNMSYFNSMHFNLERGTYLAFDYSLPVVPLNPELLEGQISSIFTISRSNECKVPEYLYDKDIIEIIIDDETYEYYNRINAIDGGALVDNTILGIIKGALTFVIRIIQETDKDSLLKDFLWYDVINYKAKQKGINMETETAEDIAEQLLGNPTKNGLKCIAEAITNCVETEDE